MKPDQEVEINEERIGVWCLMRAVSAIQTRYLEVDHLWGEEGGDDKWRATRLTGSPNDRGLGCHSRGADVGWPIQKVGGV